MPTPESISRTTDLPDSEYKWGFTTDIDTDLAPKGIDESIVKLISNKIFYNLKYKCKLINSINLDKPNDNYLI